VAVTVMVVLRVPVVLVMMAEAVARSASIGADVDGLITPARGLVWATISWVLGGRPVQLTLTDVPVVLLATNANGLPLYVQLDVDGGSGMADAGVAVTAPSRPTPSPSAPAAANIRRRTPPGKWLRRNIRAPPLRRLFLGLILGLSFRQVVRRVFCSQL
jgi:hypothetical protein